MTSKTKTGSTVKNNSAAQRAEELLKRMNLEEKLLYIGGTKAFCVRSVPRLGIPEIQMADGPVGCKEHGKSTAYTAKICAAATWNTEIARRIGESLGSDSKARGVHIILAPGLNIYRHPRCGRNFEYLGEDPFLAGKMGAAEIKGIQSQGVLATPKHFACNNQETKRDHYDAQIDERTLREIYLPAFKEAIISGNAKCIMNAYNKVNGDHCTANKFLNIEVLRNEWGFKGIVMSDWVATHDCAGAVKGGLDIEMPEAVYMTPEKIKEAIAQGKLKESEIDEKIRHLLCTFIEAGFFDKPQQDSTIPPGRPESHNNALDEAREGIVLLKNQKNFLPFDFSKVKKVAIIGPNHSEPSAYIGGGSAAVDCINFVSSADALKKIAPSCEFEALDSSNLTLDDVSEYYDAPVKLEFFDNTNLSGRPVIIKNVKKIFLGNGKDFPLEGINRVKYSMRWTGCFTAQKTAVYDFTTLSSDGMHLYIDGKRFLNSINNKTYHHRNRSMLLESGRTYEIMVEYFKTNEELPLFQLGWGEKSIAEKRALAGVKKADLVIACIGFSKVTEGEGAERSWAVEKEQIELVKKAAALKPGKVIAVLFAGGGVDFRDWMDDVPAIIHAWYPGEAGGTAIAEIISGAVNPSGKLPISIERNPEDNPSHEYFLRKEDIDQGNAVYGEGIFVGYRGYDKNKTEPLFPFGFGLSYTSFEYSDIKLKDNTVSFSVKNTGKRSGAETAQLYIAPPKSKFPRPPKELKGFAKVFLKAAESKTVSIILDESSFAYWHPDTKKWSVDPGTYEILVGASSRDIRLKTKIKR